MKLGFIGTGHITKAVVDGILGSKIKFKKIYLSKRNKKISSELSRKSKKIAVINNNQEIINKSNWIFLAVTPNVGNKILKNLKFKKNQTVVSFISTINMNELKKFVKVKAQIVRAIPLPFISLRKGPIPIFPPNKKVKSFFDKLGTSLEIKNEKLSLNFWSLSSMMAPFYEVLNTLSKWLIKRGIKKNDAQKYITSLFLALSADAVNKSSKGLDVLVKNSQTPKGLNQQALNELKKSGFFNDLINISNSILKRLKKV